MEIEQVVPPDPSAFGFGAGELHRSAFLEANPMRSQTRPPTIREAIALVIGWFLVFYATNWLTILNLGHLMGSLNRAWVLLVLILVGTLFGYGAKKASASLASLVAATGLPILIGLVWWPIARATSEYPEFFFLGLVPMVHSMVAVPFAIATWSITPSRPASESAGHQGSLAADE